jgi:PAS domain-containing protein
MPARLGHGLQKARAMADNWLMAVLLAGSCLAAAGCGVLLLWALPPHRARPVAVPSPGPEQAVFLFDGEALVDATAPARAVLAMLPDAGPPLPRLLAHLRRRLPGIDAALARLPAEGEVEVAADGDEPVALHAQWRDGVVRLTLSGDPGGPRTITLDHVSHQLIERELAELRTTVEQAPLLVWRQAADGAVTWANRAYLLLAAERDVEAEVLTWPLPRLFEAPPTEAMAGTSARRRTRVRTGVEGRMRWFDLHSLPLGSELLCFGLPADSAVQAESALREFVQTLSKTFAHLPVGLAVFDRRRELMLFNPALAELTALSPEFLSARPSLAAFLDGLRDKRRIPEPRDYRSWRERITALEEAAASGHHEETWTLPSGQTYRVTGRPHPDGAVAFLIEDISAEITLARRFRAEIETAQAVLDTLDEAVAVFSPSGVLVLTNDAYARLWGTDPGRSLGQIGIAEAERCWQAMARPTPAWAAARRFVATPGLRPPETGEAELLDGRRLRMRLSGLAGGSTLASFRTLQAPAAGQGVPAGGASRRARA